MIAKLSPDIVRQHKGISFAGVATVFLCHDGQGNIFLTKRSKNARDEHGAWLPGGGGLKWGSTAEDNLRREIKEEFDGTVLDMEFLGYRDVLRQLPDQTPTHWVALDFAVLVEPDSMKNNEPDIFDEVGWFTLDTLPDPMYSQWDIFVDRHQKKLVRILG